MSIISGFSTQIGYGDLVAASALATFVPTTYFARLTAITPPKVSVESTDSTHFESLDQFKEKKPGWKNVDDVSLTVQYEKTQDAAVNALVGVEKTFGIKRPDSVIHAFNGFINSIGDTIEKDNIVTTTITIAVSGKVVSHTAA